MPLGSFRGFEGVREARALVRALLDAVDMSGLRNARHLEHGRREVDHMRELRAQATLLLDASRPVDDRPVASAAPVRRDLLRPLERRVHRPGPADRVVVVGVRGPPLVDPCAQELGRLDDVAHPVQADHLVEGALDRAFGGGAVVADDAEDQRVVEDPELLEGVDDATDVVVGV